MDGFGGDGTRDFFTSPDSYSPGYGSFLGGGSEHPGANTSRLHFDGLHLNSQTPVFPHMEKYEGFLQGGTPGAGGVLQGETSDAGAVF